MIAAVLSLTPAAFAQTTGPVGLEAIERLDRTCEIRQGVRAYQYSSHDRSGR
ncbi:MAG: hypothetical protein GF393_12985, partial [Armatimonadia bacterium]|nr:hypothetical protein [Armatimonadia bacterium]